MARSVLSPYSSRFFPNVFTQPQLPSNSVVRHPGAQAVLQDRLPWRCPDASRFFGPASCFGPEEGTPLLYPSPSGRLIKKGLSITSWPLASPGPVPVACSPGIPKPLSTPPAWKPITSAPISRTDGGQYAGRRWRARWPKLTAVTHTASHLIAGVVVGRGPSQDSPQFPEVMRQAGANLHPYRVLADKGYDAEHNHQLCREQLGVHSTVIPLNPRNHGRKWPKTQYRREMKREFPRQQYGQPSCSATKLLGNAGKPKATSPAISPPEAGKRRLPVGVAAHGDDAQDREVLLRVLTHNLMILLLHPLGFSTEH